MDNNVLGWDGKVLWQNDFKATTTSCSQSYLVSMEQYAHPPKDLRSDDMNVRPWSTCRAQSVTVSQETATILRVTISYAFGNYAGDSGEDEARQEGVSITVNEDVVPENILASKDVRDYVATGDIINMSLLVNGMLVVKHNGLYGYVTDATTAPGSIGPPTEAKARAVWDKIVAGETTFQYTRRIVNISLSTDKVDTEVIMGVGSLSGKQQSGVTLPSPEEGRTYLLVNASVTPDSGGMYNVNLTYELSPYGGWNEDLYK